MASENILIGGGSGMIGTALSEKLLNQGFNVRILSRNPDPEGSVKQYYWNPSSSKIDDKAFKDIDYIINLTGENISGKRWTKKQKEIIENSRIHSTELLFKYISKHQVNLKAYISASAIGYYGTFNSDKILTDR